MLNVKIENTGDCVRKLLTDGVFDTFLLVSASVKVGITYLVDGRVNKGFYDNDEADALAEYIAWSDVKLHIYNIIRGKRLPLGFKLVFRLSDSDVADVLEKKNLVIAAADVAGLTLNFYYDGHALYVTATASMNTFSMDRTLEQLWDEYVAEFLKHNGIVIAQSD